VKVIVLLTICGICLVGPRTWFVPAPPPLLLLAIAPCSPPFPSLAEERVIMVEVGSGGRCWDRVLGEALERERGGRGFCLIGESYVEVGSLNERANQTPKGL
jgi:hypothetical protein